MKKFISKVKKATKDFFTNKSAFSLVELIVVIAIMAVMAAVLAPALLGYVEKSRMQKDDSAMDEVVGAVQLSLADQEIYDEVLEHSVWDNVSCYIDKKDESQFSDCKVQLKAANGDKKEQYMFGDEARLLDETVYYAAGNMRGLTITFSPSESGDTYDFANGILNKFVGRKTGILSENPELYNRLRSVIGDKLDTTSQTYRNSDYTIFIRVGSTGGSEAVMQDAIQVWGQFNGTNLAEKDHKYELSSGRVVGTAGANDANKNQQNNNDTNINFSEESASLNISGVVPEGAVYYVGVTRYILGNYNGATATYGPGDAFPELKPGDIFVYNGYEYRYKCDFEPAAYMWNNPKSTLNGWGVRVLDKTQTEYPDVLESINNSKVVSLRATYYQCSNMLKAPKIHKYIQSVAAAYSSCKTMETAPVIPSTVNDVTSAFASCFALKTYEGNKDGDGNFSNFIIPSHITNVNSMFLQCKEITHAPAIPVGVTTMNQTFQDCNKLESAPVLPNNLTSMKNAFRSTKISQFPAIPETVQNMYQAFSSCSNIADGAVLIIPAATTDASSLIAGVQKRITVKIPCSCTSNISASSKVTVETYHSNGCGH